MRIAIDAMGGDHAPGEIVAGALAGAQAYNCEIVLVGDEQAIQQELARCGGASGLSVTIQPASEIITMHEHPSAAVRKKKDASVVVAAKLVRDGQCDVAISAGSTGAAAAAALLYIGRIAGIDRPVIATPIPTLAGTTVLLDSGANVDSKPKHLLQGAIMGALYAEYILHIPRPRVGLLNIGEEETKGNELALATYPLLKASALNFIGNVEGRDIPRGAADVVVCDGFVGNVALKLAEGLAVAFMQLVKETIKQSGFIAKMASLAILPSLAGLKKKLDYAEYGGAPLLGVRGGFIICHGSSRAKAIKNAVRIAREFSQNKVVEHIKEKIGSEEVAGNAQ